MGPGGPKTTWAYNKFLECPVEIKHARFGVSRVHLCDWSFYIYICFGQHEPTFKGIMIALLNIAVDKMVAF